MALHDMRIRREPTSRDDFGEIASRADQSRAVDWSVSEILRYARQSAGYSLRDVADALCLRVGQLEAIENGRFSELPATVYAIGFVRAYAEFLDLDANEIVRRFKAEAAGIDARTELVFPAPVPEGRMPSGAILMIAVALALVGYGGWYYLSADDRRPADVVTIVPERFAELASTAETADDPVPTSGQAQATRQFEPAAANASEGPIDRNDRTESRVGMTAAVDTAAIDDAAIDTAAIDNAAVDSTAIDSTAIDNAPIDGPAVGNAADDRTESGMSGDVPGAPAAPSALAEESRPDHVVAVPGYDEVPSGGLDAVASERGEANATIEVAGLPAALEPPEPPALERRSDEGRVFGATDSQPRIVIRATAESWVQVNDANGGLVMHRILRPGDSYLVPDANGLNLITGNAGGLEILVDGERIPSLGGHGVVLRDIDLDAGRLVDGSAITN